MEEKTKEKRRKPIIKNESSEKPKYQKKTKPKTKNEENETSKYEKLVVPLNALNPYKRNWAIKVRCTNKSEIRNWRNGTKSGKLFAVDLLDNFGTEISATMFDEEVDAFSNVFFVGKVYIIAKAEIKLAIKKFDTIKNDYQLKIRSDSYVKQVEDEKEIKKIVYNFCNLKDLQEKRKNSSVDVIAVVSSVGKLINSVSKKDERAFKRRELTLEDENWIVELTLWGDLASFYDEDKLEGNPVLAVKTARVKDFGGISISSFVNTKFDLNPNLKEAQNLKNWWENKRDKKDKPIKVQRSSQIKRYPLNGIGNQIDISKAKRLKNNDIFVIKASIIGIKNDSRNLPYYNSCSKTPFGRKCNRKVRTVIKNGTEISYFCPSCNSDTTLRYCCRLNFVVCDHSDSLNVTAFDEVGECILGVSSFEFADIFERYKEDKVFELYQNALQKEMFFKVQVKRDFYKREEKVEFKVVFVQDIDYLKESMKLIEKIKKTD